MRLNTTCLILVCFACTIVSCSHPQVRDASQLDADDTKALLGAICDETQTATGCSACPAFIDAEEDGPLTVERVLHGSFSYDGADEALVEVSGCGGHDVVALEHRAGKWHRFGWEQNLSLGECEQVERENGATGLVCRTPPQAHRENLDTLALLGVVGRGRLERKNIANHEGFVSCDQTRGGRYREIANWKVGDDPSSVELTVRNVCYRTQPTQTICEAKNSGVSPLSSDSTRQAEIDWARLDAPTIGDFCSSRNILEVVHRTGPKLEECVALGGEEARNGVYIPQWRVFLDGTVYKGKAQLKQAPTDAADVAECFQRVLSKMQFAKPDGGICIVNYPFFFKDGEYWKNACGHFDPPPLEWLEAQRAGSGS